MQPIVLGTDGSEGAEAAVQKVVDIAAGSGTTVHVVCAYPGRSTLERIGLTGKSDPVNLRGVAADIVARGERRLLEAGFDVQTHVREGDAAHTLIDVADEEGADLIVVGAHGHGSLRRFALGSVSAKLSHNTPVSLLIVH
jgi:nucleotide-binding universal stress UspA family protein